MVAIVHKPDVDPATREALLDRVFGPERLKKTSYRLREGVPAIAELSFAAYEGDMLVGSVRFWPAQVVSPEAGKAAVPILILGPLAVEPEHSGRGIGQALMQRGLDRARELGHRVVILVGDLLYYARIGFRREGTEELTMPGPVDPGRLLILELVPGAAEGLAGKVEKADIRGNGPSNSKRLIGGGEAAR